MSTESGHPDMPSTVARMLRPERIQTLDPFRIMAHCPITPRDVVADVGCGPGYFTLPLAKFLINGKVYALDTSDEMIEACQSRVDEARLGNVEVLKCGEYEFPVEPGTLDGLFIAFVVHHPEDRVRFLTAAKEMLRPGGWCFILEWHKKETETGPPQRARITPEELRELGESSGFKFQESGDVNDENYRMTLIKSRLE
ncbi:MAG: class I SAM-dependent methyltransferase [Chloroflexi bacterium]|nr:class I SAM-dependent methyltransferase [Chloroflexota bacterium]